jgi:hypothetical protein
MAGDFLEWLYAKTYMRYQIIPIFVRRNGDNFRNEGLEKSGKTEILSIF